MVQPCFAKLTKLHRLILGLLLITADSQMESNGFGFVHGFVSLRGRPPFLPLIRAAAAFALLFELPPRFP
jgi:hypothetical protein